MVNTTSAEQVNNQKLFSRNFEMRGISNLRKNGYKLPSLIHTDVEKIDCNKCDVFRLVYISPVRT